MLLQPWSNAQQPAPPAASTKSPIGKTIQVPLDYDAPEIGTAPLYFEFGAPFDPSKPVVLVVTDGQQFFVQPGTVAGLQQEEFGSGFNVVGIVGRGLNKNFTQMALNKNGETDWLKAWRIFNADQWTNDIESVRKAVVGATGKVLLYGGSGGAYLVHQYLVKYSSSVLRAFTQTAVNPRLNRELGIDLDPFWHELGLQDKQLQALLRKALESHAQDRLPILLALQRQHFFVPPEHLTASRAELIRALAAGDDRPFAKAREDYQVDQILALYNSPTAIPISVREFEFIYPTGAFDKVGGESINPYLDSQYYFCKSLVELANTGNIKPPTFDIPALHQVNSEVLVLAGRSDEATDYRTSVALAYSYPNHELFIADDDHRFSKTEADGSLKRIVQAFLLYGIKSEEFKAVMNSVEFHRWRP